MIRDLRVLVEVYETWFSSSDPYRPRSGDFAACRRLRVSGYVQEISRGFLMTAKGEKFVREAARKLKTKP